MAALLFAALTSGAFARPWKLTEENPFISVDVPNHWEVDYSNADALMTVATPDGQVHFSYALGDFGAYLTHRKSSEECDPVAAGVSAFLSRYKLKVDKTTEKTLHLGELVRLNWSGECSDGQCTIQLQIIQVGAKGVLLTLFWASPAGQNKFAKEIAAIRTSLRITTDGL